MLLFIFAATNHLKNISAAEALQLVEKHLKNSREEALKVSHINEQGGETQGVALLKKTSSGGDYCIALDEPFQYSFNIKTINNRILGFCIKNQKQKNTKIRPQDISAHPISVIFKNDLTLKSVQHHFQRNDDIYTLIFYSTARPNDKLVMSFYVLPDKKLQMLIWTIQTNVSKRKGQTGLRMNVMQHLIINYKQPIELSTSQKNRLINNEDHFSYRELFKS